jgi:hypothetical protein
MIGYQVQYSPLWVVSQAPYECTQWFNRVVAEHYSSVSKPK